MNDVNSADLVPATDATRKRRGKKQSLQSGFSLLARGEPKIWFTGGMLAVCLAMIVGLLGLILVSGLPSFWVRPVDLLALADGSLEIGQQQSMEAVASGEADLATGQAVRAGDRRYYRTGNFDLTQTHYRWIEPEVLNERAIGKPTWAMVVERLEYGRLYGIPLDIRVRQTLGDSTQVELEKIQSLQTHLRLAISSESEGSTPGGIEPAAAESLIRELDERAAEYLDTAIRDELQRLASGGQESGSEVGTASIMAQTAGDGGWTAEADVPGESKLSAMELRWTKPEEVVAQLEREVLRVENLRDEAEHFKHQISRLDARLSELRIDVRRAELDSKTQASVQVESSHFLLEQEHRLKLLPKAVESSANWAGEFLAADPDLATAATSMLDGYGKQLPAEIAAVQSQIEVWMAPVDSQPEGIRQAVQNYLDGYRSLVVQKQPLIDSLEVVERELELAQVRFAVPTGASVLAAVAGDEASSLVDGTLPDAVKARLADANPGLASLQMDDVAASEVLGEQLAILSMFSGGEREIYALTAIPAASGPNTAVEDSPQADATQTSRQLLQLASVTVPCEEIVRAAEVNRLTLSGKLSVYIDRWGEFLWDNPREANTEGGVFPAIWGTIVMTLIMTVAVVPFGVMAALYLREYTTSGPLVSLIRISINNLAGVPSIVYGVFGFSFFCYTIGAFIDGGAQNADIAPWPPIIWFVTLGGLALVGTAAFFCSFLSGGPSHNQTRGKKWLARLALTLWLVSVAAMALLVLKSPFFEGFYREYLPNPTYGKGGLLWAAFTLALLTLPVVIVATEEALAAVPNSLREGSLACGASKWQTIRRIILPHARPGIMTGAILAMARGAGEVAPLMLVGALPSAPDLPLDSEFPFFHGSRSFMHLGYQIYTLGFQSQNSEAAKPMVFTCTLLLISIIAALNMSAIYLRARLKRRFLGNQF